MKGTIFGGDVRMLVAADELRKSGITIDTTGLTAGDKAHPESSDFFLLPVPTTKDGETVYCPQTNEKILLSNIAAMAGSRPVLCCNTELQTERCIDYCKTDAYALRNAVPTAEGAIYIGIERLPITLWQARVLVIGFGRVGKILCDRLNGFGCRLTVAARKPADWAMCEALGYATADSRYPLSVRDFDLVYNTVDAPLPEHCPCDTVIIDLAGRSGLKDLALKNYLHAPGLPGKIAPLTAGKILAQTVLELIENEGVPIWKTLR